MRTDRNGRPYHPAKFSAPILELFGNIIFDDALVFDPFAGTGKIHEVPNIQAWGMELEPEWATMHPRTIVGNALHLPIRPGSLPYIVTSPTYGNRMADHHNAKDGSIRNTYKHSLGRDLHPDNSGQLHWGPQYRKFHRKVWRQCWDALAEGGYLIVNVSNFYKGDGLVKSAFWHSRALQKIGFRKVERHKVKTRRHGQGANGKKRDSHEYVYVFQKVVDSQEHSDTVTPDHSGKRRRKERKMPTKKTKAKRITAAELFALAATHEEAMKAEAAAKKRKKDADKLIIEELLTRQKVRSIESDKYGDHTRITVVQNESIVYDEEGIYKDLPVAGRRLAFDRNINFNALPAATRKAILEVVPKDELKAVTRSVLNVEKMSQAVQAGKIDAKLVAKHSEIKKAAPYVRVSHGSGE